MVDDEVVRKQIFHAGMRIILRYYTTNMLIKIMNYKWNT